MRYINPGYGELFPNDIYNAERFRFFFATIDDWTHNPQNGVMAYATNGTTSWLFSPILTAFDGEIYGRYTVYCADDEFRGWCLCFGRYYPYIGVFHSSVSASCGSLSYSRSIADNNGLHDVYFHLKFADGGNDGIFELIVDGVSLLSGSHSESYPPEEYVVRLCCEEYWGSNYRIGNIILSDEPIGINEKIVILPTNSIETDMNDNGDGTYTSNGTGQTILQTIDAQTLITEYGGNSKVTGIATAALPCYSPDYPEINEDNYYYERDYNKIYCSGLYDLIGIDKISGAITEHGTISARDLSSYGVVDAWNIDSTLEALNGKQVGLKEAV